MATLVGVVAALIGVVAAVLQLPALGIQRSMDDLSLEAIECTKSDGGLVSSNIRKAVIVFLMLSEDELDLRGQGWIAADTWELWRAGMAVRLGRWPFHEVSDEVRNRENDAVHGQYGQPRKAGDRLYEAGFDPKPARKRGPGWVTDVSE